MQVLGIDVGFGFTKAYDGVNNIIFNSVMGDATDIQFQASLGTTSPADNIHISIDGKEYFIGEFAQRQSHITDYTLDQEKLIQQFVKVMAITAAGLCTSTSQPMNVVTGLPVGFLKRDSGRLKQIIHGNHEISFHTLGQAPVTKAIHIDKVAVIPQPIGSIFNLIFDEFGKMKDKGLSRQKLGVVDIGFKTTDYSIFDHLQYIERGSSTMDTGMSKCFSVIANKLYQESSVTIELYRMFQFIDSALVKIRGQEYNISNLKKRVFSHAASAIASDLNRLWHNDWDLDTVILSGGGSVALGEFLSPLIKGNLLVPPRQMDARFNNVYGYRKFGMYKWHRYDEPESSDAKKDAAQNNTDTSSAGSTETSAADGVSEAKENSSKKFPWLRKKTEE